MNEKTEVTPETLQEVIPRSMLYSRWYNTRVNDYVTSLCSSQISEDDVYFLVHVPVNGEHWKVTFRRNLEPEDSKTTVTVSR